MMIWGGFLSSIFWLFSSAIVAETLPSDYLRKFQTYQNYRSKPRAPLAAKVFVDGKRLKGFQKLETILSEKFYYFIPLNKKIRESLDDQGRVLWDYPVGTVVGHFLQFKDDAQTPFELRLVKKQEEGWDFAMYFYHNDEFKRQSYSGRLAESYQLDFEKARRKISLEHIPLNTCQRCHFMTSSASYQYSGLDKAGPCEFTPNNPNLEVKVETKD